MQNEEWRDIEGFPDYQISNLGRIKSFTKYKDGKILNNYLTQYGYVGCLLKNKDGKSKNRFVHRLVAIAFIPNPHGYPQINHKNGIRSDCRVDNLEWCTASQNMRHAYDVLGFKSVRGEANAASKLTEEKVKEIYAFAMEEVLTTDEIGEMYDVTQSVVSKIKSGMSWSHVTGKAYVNRQHGKNPLTDKTAKEVHKLDLEDNISIQDSLDAWV